MELRKEEGSGVELLTQSVCTIQEFIARNPWGGMWLYYLFLTTLGGMCVRIIIPIVEISKLRLREVK